MGCEKADKKVERLRKIVKEAAEQSHRSEIPEVHAPHHLSNCFQ